MGKDYERIVELFMQYGATLNPQMYMMRLNRW